MLVCSSSALGAARGPVWEASESGLFTAGELPPDGIGAEPSWLKAYGFPCVP